MSHSSTYTLLHTEASMGWGGQEIRILKESLGLSSRGWNVILACDPQSQLFAKALDHNLALIPVSWSYQSSCRTIKQLVRAARDCDIKIFNTHSSKDSWIGSIAARLAGCKVVRTRHLSTPIQGGLNAKLLYGKLADAIVCTSQDTVRQLRGHLGDKPSIECIPTGVDEEAMGQAARERSATRAQLGIKEGQIAVGTACVLRSWKGLEEFIEAASLFCADSSVRFFIFGGGAGLEHYQSLQKSKFPHANITFTGHLNHAPSAISALDIFCLLSTAHEGISQSSLQAAYLKKPLVTTTVGGLPEVCIHGKTGFCVEPRKSGQVYQALQTLVKNPQLCLQMGQSGFDLVKERFTFDQTLNQMEQVFRTVVFDKA